MNKIYKNNIIIGLCAVVLLMAIGFAAYSQRLEIEDTATSTSEWNVYIKSVEATNIVGKASGSGLVTDRETATLTTTLVSPGDFVTYTITVANDGNIDAVLDVITLSASNNDSVIKYSYTGIIEDENLFAKTEKSFTVTVEYDPEKTGTATESQKKNNLTLDLDYVQKGTETITPKVPTLNLNGVNVPVVTSGDGLYVDSIDTDRYIYRGDAPNNYIWLDLNDDGEKTDEENYRIVSVESDNTIKVIAQNSVVSTIWDSSGNRESSGYSHYTYSNAWGSNTTTYDSSGLNLVTQMAREIGGDLYDLPTTEAYLNKYLNTTFFSSIDTNFQSKIETKSFNVGLLSNTSGQTLETDLLQEAAYKWKGKIALINATDYVKASTNSKCVSVYEYMYNSDCFRDSDQSNYLYLSENEWLLSPRSSKLSNYAWYITDTSGRLYCTDTLIFKKRNVRPSFYLTSNIVLRGEGTETEPYVIVS